MTKLHDDVILTIVFYQSPVYSLQLWFETILDTLFNHWTTLLDLTKGVHMDQGNQQD